MSRPERASGRFPNIQAIKSRCESEMPLEMAIEGTLVAEAAGIRNFSYCPFGLPDQGARCGQASLEQELMRTLAENGLEHSL